MQVCNPPAQAHSQYPPHSAVPLEKKNAVEIHDKRTNSKFNVNKHNFYDLIIQGLLEFNLTEECSGRSSNPGPALAILVL